MSGLTAPGRGPDNDAQLIRQLYDVIRRLDNQEVVRVGEWSLYTDPDTGNLMKARPGQVNAVGEAAEPEVFDLTASRGFILKDVANAVYEGVTQTPIAAGEADKGLDDIRAVLGNIPAISVPDLLSGFKAFFDQWFDRNDGTGSVPELTYTIGAIKQAIINGYTVIGFSTDSAGYVVPDHVEARAILVGGGQTATGSAGGLHGSYLSIPIDLKLPTVITTLDFQVGTAGNRSFIRAGVPGSPHTGTVIAESPIHGTAGGVGDVFGLSPTTSLPGSGGTGATGGSGGGADTNATAGESTPFASGGAPGSNGNFGTAGQPGGSVSPDAKIKSGGAGGGGGGRANVAFNGGGNGGAGGWPGGGGGGRGSGQPNGTPGPGAPGVIYFFYK